MGKITQQAQAEGVTVQDYLTALMAQHGSYRQVAKAIGVHTSAVSLQMAKFNPQRNRGQLEQLASEQGQTVVEYINGMIAKYGSIKAVALELGYTRTALLYHLKKGAK